MTLRWSYLARNLFLEDRNICMFVEVRLMYRMQCKCYFEQPYKKE